MHSKIFGLNPFAISSILAAASSLGFGWLVLFRSENKRLGRVWCLFASSVAMYGVGGIFFSTTTDPDRAFLWWHIAYAVGVIWIAPAFFHFICEFIERPSRVIKIHYGIGFVFLLILPSHVFFSRVRWMFDSFYYAYEGVLYPIFFAWWMSLILYSHAELIRAFTHVSPKKRNQIKYFMAATVIGFGGGCLSYLPDFGIDLYPWGNFAICLYPLIMSYAILKHQLMDIRIVIRKTLLYSLISAGLASVYAGAVTLLARLMESQTINPIVLTTDALSWLADKLKNTFPHFCIAMFMGSIGLGLFVWWKGRRQAIQIMWALTCLSIGLWSFGYGMLLLAHTQASALWWMINIHYLGALLIPVFFFHFVTLVVNRRYPVLLGTGYGLAALCEALNFSSVLVGLWNPATFFHFYPKPLNSFYLIFLSYFFFYAVFAHILLWKEMSVSSGARRNQMKWIFWGTSVGFCGGATTFLMAYGIPIFPFGVYAVPLYIVTVSYAIFKHQLMDINVVIRKTLLYSLVSAALASVYVGTITLLAHVLGGRHGSASAFSSALAAVFITVLFNPLRHRLQVFIDRKFSRSHLVGSEQLAKLSSEVIGHETLEKIAESAGRILEEAVHPRLWALYLRTADDREFVKAVSADAETLPERMPLVNVWSRHFLNDVQPNAVKLNVVKLNDVSLNAVEQNAVPVAVAVPLMGGRDILGYLLLGEKRSEEPYREEDLVLLRIVANQAAVAFERSKMVQQISGAFVHEIKMPLANISLPAELTFMDIADVETGKKRVEDLLPKIKKRMKYIMNQARLASHKVEAVRQVSEPEDAVQPDVDLQEIVRRGLKQLDPLIRDARVQVSLQWPKDAVLISARPQQLEIVLVNLMKNAVEAMVAMSNGASRQLQVRAHEEEEALVLEVGDTGPGIKAEDLPMLFQSHWSTKGAGGMGVGLFLSRQIIQAHGGTLDVQTQEGQGTTFVIRLRKTLKGAHA